MHNHYFAIGIYMSTQAKTSKPDLSEKFKFESENYLAQRIQHFNHGEFEFKVIDTGPLDGKPVILLHGFPEVASSWEKLSDILIQHGYRTFAIEQRGYSKHASPKGRFQYRIDQLAGDVYQFIKKIQQPVYLIGHDWGSIVACELARRNPEVIKHLTLVSVPHKGAFIQAMFSSAQIFASYYMAFFQLPVIPEFVFKKMPKFKHYFLKNSGMTDEQIADFNQNFIEEDRIGTAINWYRSMPLTSPRSIFQKITVPTLFVWGKKDIAVWEKSAHLNKKYFSNTYREAFLDATHWIPNQNAQELSLHFLNAVKVGE